MIKKYWFLLFCLIAACTTPSKREPASELSVSLWSTDRTYYKIDHPLIDDVYLRTGSYLEAKDVPFKGCVIYLEGLGDSVANQHPLFNYLSQSGYRVIFFDFMGQGESGGSMNNTRLLDPASPSLQISNQAKFVWQKYSSTKDELYGRSCAQSKKLVMGWSTGGLAAYGLAYEQWADAVALIAPGIHVKTLVGESATSPSMLLSGAQVITERTLTRNTFTNGVNPHIEAIKPISPAQVPLFAANLWWSSQISQTWKMPANIKGIVFLSGAEDTYVNRDETLKTLKKNAPHYHAVVYDGALHEIQNEMPKIASDLYLQTARFFDNVVGK